MKNILKSYLTFLPGWYRILILVLLPAGTAALYAILPQGGRFWLGMFMPGILVYIELLADFGTFGGFLKSGGRQLDYVRSSIRGMTYIGHCCAMDLLRRFVWMAGLCLLLGVPAAGVLAFLLVTLVMNGTRYIDSLSIYLVVSMLAVIAFPLICFMEESWGVSSLILLLLSIVCSVLLQFHLLHNVRKSFFDGKERV